MRTLSIILLGFGLIVTIWACLISIPLLGFLAGACFVPIAGMIPFSDLLQINAIYMLITSLNSLQGYLVATELIPIEIRVLFGPWFYILAAFMYVATGVCMIFVFSIAERLSYRYFLPKQLKIFGVRCD